jgi:di/tricarboxylate transporter
MPLSARIALAFALSLAAASALQQTLMLIYDNGAEPRALPPLGICVVLIAIVFGLVLWLRPSAIGWTAIILLAVMLMLGGVIYHLGVNDLRPGVGGNIGYLIAMLMVSTFCRRPRSRCRSTGSCCAARGPRPHKEMSSRNSRQVLRPLSA